MKTILVYNRKGGIGKTVTCMNVAGCLDRVYKKRVLICDCDAQSNTTSKLLSPDDPNADLNIVNLFNPKFNDYTGIIRKVRVPDKKNEDYVDTNIWLLPGSREIDNIDTTEMFVLKDFLDMYEDDFDYCLMDCSPSLTNMTINAMCVADYILIPAFAGSDSVNGYGMVINEIDRMKENGYNVNIKVLGVFLNAVDKRRSVERFFRGLWVNEFQKNVFDSQIRDSADIPNSYEFCKPIHYFKPSGPVARDYDQLVEEMLNKIELLEKGMK